LGGAVDLDGICRELHISDETLSSNHCLKWICSSELT